MRFEIINVGPCESPYWGVEAEINKVLAERLSESPDIPKEQVDVTRV